MVAETWPQGKSLLQQLSPPLQLFHIHLRSFINANFKINVQYWFSNIYPNAIQSWSKMTGDLASSDRMRKSFGVSPESASTRDQMCASSHKSDSKVIALHLKNSWKPHIRCDFKLTHPLCKPFHHCLWWSIHLARHWLRSSDGKDSVLYCSQAEVETSWLGTNREENADSIIPDPEPDCPPVMPIVVVRISWKHFDSRKIITQFMKQVFGAVIVY